MLDVWALLGFVVASLVVVVSMMAATWQVSRCSVQLSKANRTNADHF